MWQEISTKMLQEFRGQFVHLFFSFYRIVSLVADKFVMCPPERICLADYGSSHNSDTETKPGMGRYIFFSTFLAAVVTIQISVADMGLGIEAGDTRLPARHERIAQMHLVRLDLLLLLLLLLCRFFACMFVCVSWRVTGGWQDYFDCLLEIAIHENGRVRASESDVIRQSLEKICVNVLFVMQNARFSAWADSGRVVAAVTRISVVACRVERRIQEKRARRESREIHGHIIQILGHILRRLGCSEREDFFRENPGARKAFALV
jgi:hypothetical protein